VLVLSLLLIEAKEQSLTGACRISGMGSRNIQMKVLKTCLNLGADLRCLVSLNRKHSSSRGRITSRDFVHLGNLEYIKGKSWLWKQSHLSAGRNNAKKVFVVVFEG